MLGYVVFEITEFRYYNKFMEEEEFKVSSDKIKKGPVNFIIGSLTSFLLCISFYSLSQRIAIYFYSHRPSNSSEIVQSISTSFNTLIIGLFFLATFSFAFIGLGLFIVFIRCFLVKNE